MRSSSIYEALDLSPTCPTEEIQVSLRSVLRRFWAVPRDATGDTEEAVRFVALAASILVDPIRRKDYDAALSPSVGAGPWRLPVGSGRDTTAEAAYSVPASEAGVEGSRLSSSGSGTPKFLPGVDSIAEPLPEAKAWYSSVAKLAAVAASLLLLGAFAQPFAKVPDVPFAAAAIGTVIAAILAFIVAKWIASSDDEPVAAAGLSRLAVIKWRREGSIFLGHPAPQHDTAWIFKLRLMELTRSASGYVTATSVGRRVSARLFDYALVTLFVSVLLACAQALAPSLDDWWLALRSPLVLPVLVVLLTIPVEAWLTLRYRTTVGKWLFGLVVVTGASRPADHAQPSAAQLVWTRASRAAWVGAAAGVWPLALLRLKRVLRSARERETEWDASGDAVMVARPMTLTAATSGLMVVAAVAVILVSGWRQDFLALKPALSASAKSTASSGADVWGSAKGQVTSAVTSVSSTLAQLGSGSTKGAPNPADPAQATVDGEQKPAPVAGNAAVTHGSVTPGGAISGQAGAAQRPTPAPSPDEASIARLSAEATQRRQRMESFVRDTEAARRTGDFSALQGLCKRWTVDQPANAQAWQCLGLAQYQNGAGREALPALRQSLKLQGKDPAVEAAILNIIRQ